MRLSRRDPSRIVLAGAALVGLAVSVYLTVAHYAQAPLACVQGGVVNCDLVTKSSYGIVPGTAIPVSAAGILWFGVSLGLALVGASWARAAAPAWAAAATLVVLYLVYAELRLGRICEWCTLVHLLVALWLLVAVGRLVQPQPPG